MSNPSYQMSPIYAHQREQVRQLLRTAELALLDVKEGRYNLDPDTRRTLCYALDNLGQTGYLLGLQPLVPPVQAGAATLIVHTPAGPVPACAAHAAKLSAVMEVLGTHTISTPAEAGAECSNCKNEAQRLEGAA